MEGAVRFFLQPTVYSLRNGSKRLKPATGNGRCTGKPPPSSVLWALMSRATRRGC